MKVAIIYINTRGQFRIHAANCRDVARDAARSDIGAWYLEAKDQHTVNLDCWGDIASDDHEEGSEEWHTYVDECAAIESVFLPCVGNLPAHKEN